MGSFPGVSALPSAWLLNHDRIAGTCVRITYTFTCHMLIILVVWSVGTTKVLCMCVI